MAVQREAWNALLDSAMLVDGPCVEWPGPRNGKGYGLVAPSLSPIRIVSRGIWVAHRGPVPTSLYVLHRCDNPPCGRVAHLFLGTIADNSADMVAKGRSPKNVSWSKLTNDQVAEIRRRRTDGALLRELAEEYGVSRSFLSRMTRGERR